MPSHGQHSFLLRIILVLLLALLCVNALTRATLISTHIDLKPITIPKTCQCPHTGNTHFYGKNVKMYACGITGVNALTRATLISTIVGVILNSFAAGVNALTRATLISTTLTTCFSGIGRRVSMPSHGQHSFLREVP